MSYAYTALILISKINIYIVKSTFSYRLRLERLLGTDIKNRNVVEFNHVKIIAHHLKQCLRSTAKIWYTLECGSSRRSLRIFDPQCLVWQNWSWTRIKYENNIWTGDARHNQDNIKRTDSSKIFPYVFGEIDFYRIIDFMWISLKYFQCTLIKKSSKNS